MSLGTFIDKPVVPRDYEVKCYNVLYLNDLCPTQKYVNTLVSHIHSPVSAEKNWLICPPFLVTVFIELKKVVSEDYFEGSLKYLV